MLHYSKFFDGWLAYGGYGVPKSSARYAKLQGGRDMEAMHIHYFYDMGNRRTVAQYKFNERPESLYIPDIPIGVIYSDFDIPLTKFSRYLLIRPKICLEI